MGIITTVAFIALLTTLSSIVALLIVKVPFVPTPKRNLPLVMEALAIKPGERFYDLGCGDGRMVINAARKGAVAMGFDMSPWAYIQSRFNIWIANVQARVYFRNFFDRSLSDADVIFIFLVAGVMPALEEKLLRELKPGARVVSYGFAFPNWQAKNVIPTNSENPKASKIYEYQK